MSLLSAAACARRAPGGVDAGASASTTASGGSIAASSADVTPPAPAVQTASFRHVAAYFRKDALDECVEFTVDVTPSADAGADWRVKSEKAVQEHFKKMHGKDKNLTEVQTSCAEAFADRTVLATCSAATDMSKGDAGAGSVVMTVESSYYNFATVGEDDTFMKQCLEIKGKWKALSRDSHDWRVAQLKSMNARHHRMVDHALEQADEPE
jgi:hypothetical protein